MKSEEIAWALITGASSGIGYQYARILAAQKIKLLIVSNEEQAIHQQAAALEQEFGIEVRSLYLDLSLVDAADRLMDYCRQEKLQIDILINNAGIFYFGEQLDQPVQRTRQMLQLHVVTPTLLCRLFGAEMKRRGYGYILNMSSLSAWSPYPGIALYASTKRYLKNFSRAFRSEVLPYGVSVTWLCPGAVATDLYHLNHRLQRLAIRLGVMMRPEKLARRGIRALFHKRGQVIPGFINWLFIPWVVMLPAGFIRWSMRKSGLLPLRHE